MKLKNLESVVEELIAKNKKLEARVEELEMSRSIICQDILKLGGGIGRIERKANSLEDLVEGGALCRRTITTLMDALEKRVSGLECNSIRFLEAHKAAIETMGSINNRIDNLSDVLFMLADQTTETTGDIQ